KPKTKNRPRFFRSESPSPPTSQRIAVAVGRCRLIVRRRSYLTQRRRTIHQLRFDYRD
ncbi:hypothetical protein TorRG33x02_102640, partial [Trema orientale]